MFDRLRTGSILRLLLSFALLMTAASAQMFDMPSGAYGPPPPSFGPTTRCFDLSQADTGSWMVLDPDGDGPDGVYDPNLRLVVYRFESLVFPDPPGTETYTYTFKNHITNCPVVFLIENDFDLPMGVTLTLDGEDSIDIVSPEINLPSSPGPGGFRGGHSGTPGVHWAGPGLGIGGGELAGSHSFSCFCCGVSDSSLQANSGYIPSSCIPLIGGSGGASTNALEQSGGAGGGAILIAVGGTANIDGLIAARGGRGEHNIGNGSGGAVRFAANAFSGTGQISVLGGEYSETCSGSTVGGPGQIRIETPDTFAFAATGITLFDDIPSIVPPTISSGMELKLWPEAADPFIRITSIGGQGLGTTTTGSFTIPDVVLSGTPSLLVTIETRSIDPSTVFMYLRATQKHSPGQTSATSGVRTFGPIDHFGTAGGFDQWEIVVPEIPGGYTAYQAYVEYQTP